MIDSRHQQLSNEEIVDIAAQNTGSPYSPEQVRAAVMAEVREPNTLALQEGNTLFVVHRSEKDPSVAVFRALNADTANNYLQNSIVFTKTMKSMGFRAMVTTFYDPSILNIFKYISQNPPFPGMGYQAQQMKDGGFYVTVNLGSGQSGLGSIKERQE